MSTEDPIVPEPQSQSPELVPTATTQPVEHVEPTASTQVEVKTEQPEYEVPQIKLEVKTEGATIVKKELPNVALRQLTTQQRLVEQFEFYFSPSNAPHDRFLWEQIQKDPEGFVPIEVIATFNKIKRLTTDLKVIEEAISQSPKLIVKEGRVRSIQDYSQYRGRGRGGRGGDRGGRGGRPEVKMIGGDRKSIESREGRIGRGGFSGSTRPRDDLDDRDGKKFKTEDLSSRDDRHREDDCRREEPRRDEPRRDDKRRDEPIKSEHRRPRRDDLGRNERRDEPRRDDSRRYQPPRRDERRHEPRREESRRDERLREEVRRDDKRRDEPRREEPRRDSTKVEPRRDEPRRDSGRDSYPLREERRDERERHPVREEPNREVLRHDDRRRESHPPPRDEPSRRETYGDRNYPSPKSSRDISPVRRESSPVVIRKSLGGHLKSMENQPFVLSRSRDVSPPPRGDFYDQTEDLSDLRRRIYEDKHIVPSNVGYSRVEPPREEYRARPIVRELSPEKSYSREVYEQPRREEPRREERREDRYGRDEREERREESSHDALAEFDQFFKSTTKQKKRY